MLHGVSGPLLSTSFAESKLMSAFEGRLGEATRSAGYRRTRQWWPRAVAALGPVSSLRSICDIAALPFVHTLGYQAVDLSRSGSRLTATLTTTADHIVGLLVSHWGQELGAVWREAVRFGTATDAPWCFCFNGRRVRVVDTRRTYARRFLELDLALAFEDEFTFGVLWGLLRAEALEPVRLAEPPHAPQTRSATLLDAIVESSERHQAAVCGALQHGVHDALIDFVQGFMSAGRRPGARGPRAAVSSMFEQSLTIVYRILFLLFAEARGLLPVWHPIYRDSYTIASLGRQIERLRPPQGLWEALQAISRLAYSGCDAGDLRVTPFNGRLFSPTQTPLAEAGAIDDASVERALRALTIRASKSGVGYERIGYADLGVEQLGSVYERVLDFTPERTHGPTGRSTIRLRGGRDQRKASGSFYTPRAITDYLVRRTLHPLIEGASANAILNLRVVDPAMGSGAFLVAACRYLSEAYEAALVRDGDCAAGDVTDADRAVFKRRIAQRCLYGVDLNPMAVQLARLSLWLTTLAADRPLTFFDHHLRVGDSLIGASGTDLQRQPPGTTRRKRRSDVLPLFDAAQMHRTLRDVVPSLSWISTEHDDTLATVRRKERALAHITAEGSPLSRWKAVLDLWCAYWFWREGRPAPPPSAFPALTDTLLDRRSDLSDRITATWLVDAAAIAADRALFHWTLEFPEAFFDVNGLPLDNPGFDAVLANPPWDMVRADAGDARQRQAARRATHQLTRFARDSGTYAAQASGHANRYQFFVERALVLARQGGRIGLVVPAGLASDHGCRYLRRLLLDRCDTDMLVGFENRRAIFPVHRSVKFLLLTSTSGRPTSQIRCRFGEQRPETLDTIADTGLARGFPVTLTPALIARVSGAALTIPDLRTAHDVAIVDHASVLAPPLGAAHGWTARFGRELNATDDRPSLREGGRGLPVLGGRHIRPFSVDLTSSRFRIRRDVARTLLDAKTSFGRPRLAYRDVASATNRRTLIAAIVPLGTVTTHTLSCLKTDLEQAAQHFPCGVLNSFVVNYLARQRVTTHVTTAIVEQLPVPTLSRHDRIFMEITALARRLARHPDDRLESRLQALVARLYRLTVEDFDHVLGTFPLVSADERARALDEFRRLKHA